MAGRPPPLPATGSSLSFLGGSGDRSVPIVRTHPARAGELRRPLWFVAALSVFGTASSPRPSQPSEPVGGNRTSRPPGRGFGLPKRTVPVETISPLGQDCVCVCLKLLDEDYEKQRLPRPGRGRLQSPRPRARQPARPRGVRSPRGRVSRMPPPPTLVAGP